MFRPPRFCLNPGSPHRHNQVPRDHTAGTQWKPRRSPRELLLKFALYDATVFQKIRAQYPALRHKVAVYLIGKLS